jgi:hypothetical protein
MSITVTVAEIDKVGSHWLTETKEELFPALTMTLPRVGTVRVQFSVDRYVSSFYDEETDTTEDRWTEWRIYPRVVAPSRGVGEVTMREIRLAGEVVICEWLDGDGYRESRKTALAHTVKRAILDERLSRYAIEHGRRALRAAQDELRPADVDRFAEALGHLEQAAALLDQ